jgi:hypothetical protein
MKCGHCAANLERHEWFCPNCKRGSRRENVVVRPARRSLGLFLATGLAVLALSATLGSRWSPLEATPTSTTVVNWTPPASPTATNALHLATYATSDNVAESRVRTSADTLAPTAAPSPTPASLPAP